MTTLTNLDKPQDPQVPTDEIINGIIHDDRSIVEPKEANSNGQSLVYQCDDINALIGDIKSFEPQKMDKYNSYEMKIKKYEVTTLSTTSQLPTKDEPPMIPPPMIPPPTSNLNHSTVIPEKNLGPVPIGHYPSNRKESKDTIRTIGRHSTFTTTTANSSGMDRHGYDEAHTISIPKAYSHNDLAVVSGSDRFNNPQAASNRHRFNRGNSFHLKNNQRRRHKMKADDRYVIPGQRVVEGHHNYIMAYNMITGIRIAVSRCSKLPGPIQEHDFTKVSKLIFDMEGNTMTPSSKYEFKFKDYAPDVFRRLRGQFNIDQADYLLSLTETVSLTELGSPGKSGSFFYYSTDYKFIIKTIHHSEHRQLRRVLKDYYEYVQENPGTLLSQFYGLHRLKMHSRTGIQKVHFLVMNNIFPAHRELHMKFDLKGSTQGRVTDVQKANASGKSEGLIILKDLNLLHDHYKLQLGPIKKSALFEQLTKDIKILERLNIMDYSLLVGIHDLDQSETDDPSNRLSNFDPPEMRTTTYSPIFADEDGGIRATNENNEEISMVYYMGVIDCLTNYSTFKKMETFLRSLKHKRETISAIPPIEYGERFLKFMDKAIATDSSRKNGSGSAPNSGSTEAGELQS